MKIYVICDLEGTAGVNDHSQQCKFSGKYYEQARRLATFELNSLVEGVLEGGATEVVAWDGHGNFPGGLDIELLHSACKLVMGAGDGGPVGLDNTFDAMFLCGLHAMAGTPGGVLDHSFWPGIKGCWVNELPWGEIAMNCYTAGSCGVPTVFISGDRMAAEEAKNLISNIEVAIVKEGLAQQPLWLSPAPTLSLTPKKACDIINKKAKNAMTNIDKITPYFIKPPYTIRTQFSDQKLAEKASSTVGVDRLDDFTVARENCENLELIL